MNKRNYISEQPNGQFVRLNKDSDEVKDALAKEARRSEIAAGIEKLQAELKVLTATCSHPVSYDTAGMPYDVRHCVACGRTSLI